MQSSFSFTPCIYRSCSEVVTKPPTTTPTTPTTTPTTPTTTPTTTSLTPDTDTGIVITTQPADAVLNYKTLGYPTIVAFGVSANLTASWNVLFFTQYTSTDNGATWITGSSQLVYSNNASFNTSIGITQENAASYDNMLIRFSVDNVNNGNSTVYSRAARIVIHHLP
jgi:hypothetical protein